MLYGIGLIILLLSASFVGGSVIVPMAMAVTGIVLMRLGRRGTDGKHADAKR